MNNSSHEPVDGTPANAIEGTVTPLGIGYRVELLEHITIGGSPFKRPLNGGVVATITTHAADQYTHGTTHSADTHLRLTVLHGISRR